MGENKAQVTLFIIIGIASLFLFAGGIVVYNNVSQKDSEPVLEKAATIEQKKSTVETFVDQCLEEVGKEGVLTIGLQGGYYELPEYYFSFEYADVPYYYYLEDISQVPSKAEILSNLASYIDDNIGYCLDGFEEFAKKGYDIEAGEPSTVITVGDTKLMAKLKMPLNIKKNGVITRHDSFSADYDMRFDDVYSILNEIVTNIIIDPYRIYYSLILTLMDDYDVQIDTLTYSEDTVLYVIQDPESVINDVEFMFMFGIRINTSNNAPMFELSDMTAKVGEEFYYKVEAYDRENEWLEYSVVDQTLFGIHPHTGEINFIPAAEDVGVHDITISVSDGFEITSRTIKFTIEAQ